MGGYQFLLANYDDIPEVVNIYHSLIGTLGCTWDLDYPNRASAESDVDSRSLYILKQNDKIVAVASVGEFNELGDLPWTPVKPCELMRVGVIPTLHNQGIGTILLHNVIGIAKERGYDGIIMLVSKTNPAAIALYEKNGFEKCGEVFRFGIDFFRFQLLFSTVF